VTPKEQIVALLPKLTAAERGEVLTALKFLGTLAETPRGSGGVKHPEPGDFLFEGIVEYLKKEGLVSGKNVSYDLQRRDAYKQFKLKWESQRMYIARLIKQSSGGTRYNYQVAFICAAALADLLRKKGIFSVSAMLSQIDKIPEALEDAFPGYVSSGMFGFILNRKELP